MKTIKIKNCHEVLSKYLIKNNSGLTKAETDLLTYQINPADNSFNILQDGQLLKKATIAGNTLINFLTDILGLKTEYSLSDKDKILEQIRGLVSNYDEENEKLNLNQSGIVEVTKDTDISAIVILSSNDTFKINFVNEKDVSMLTLF